MKRLLISLLMPLLLLGIGCSPDIKGINKNPEKHDGKEIEIRGIVKSFNMAGSDILYQVTDNSSGEDDDLIWVLRGKDSKRKTVPNANNPITVKGVIESERMIQNKKYGPIIVEVDAQEELAKDSAVPL